MEILEQASTDVELKLQVIIESQEMNSLIDNQLYELTKSTKLPGFRTGKVPYNIIKQKYYATAKQKIIQQKLQSTINSIIHDRSLNLIMDPVITNLYIGDNNEIKFDVEFVLMPKLQISDFSKITIEKPKLKLSEQDIETEINILLKQHKDFYISSNEACLGDQLIIDAKGYINNKPIKNAILKDYKLVLGSNTLIQDFENQLIGKKTGDNINIEVQFPEEYHAKMLKGRLVQFDVMIKSILSGTIPQLNEDIMKKYNCRTIEEFKALINENIIKKYDYDINLIIKMNLFDKLDSITNFPISDKLINKELDVLYEEYKLEYNNDEPLVTQEKFYDDHKQLAVRRVKIGLLLMEYAKNKNLFLKEEDLKYAIALQIETFPDKKNQILELYKTNPKALEKLKGSILENKSISYMLNNDILFKEKEYSLEEIKKI